MKPSARREDQPNSAIARDIAYAVHPYTNLKRHLETGPLVITRGEGVRARTVTSACAWTRGAQAGRRAS